MKRSLFKAGLSVRAESPSHPADAVGVWRSKVVCYPVVWLEHRFGKPYFSWRGFNSEKRQRLSLQRLALGRGAVGHRVWLCRNLLFCSWCITISITARSSRGGTRVPSKPRVLLHPDSVCPTPFHLDLFLDPHPHDHHDHDHRTLSPKSWAVLLWGSAVQVNQSDSASLHLPVFLLSTPTPPSPLFPQTKCFLCTLRRIKANKVPRATTENGFQNKSTPDPYGSHLSTSPPAPAS